MLDRLDSMAIAARVRLFQFLNREEGAVDIVAIVVMIGIVVVLAIIFKNRLSNMLNNLLSTAENKANEVWD